MTDRVRQLFSNRSGSGNRTSPASPISSERKDFVLGLPKPLAAAPGPTPAPLLMRPPSPGTTTGKTSSERLKILQHLNEQLLLELDLLDVDYESLMDEERRAQPRNPTVGLHLSLAWSHMLHGCSTGVSGLQDAISRGFGLAPERTPVTPTQAPATPSRAAPDSKPPLTPTPNRDTGILGGEAAAESHLQRKMKKMKPSASRSSSADDSAPAPVSETASRGQTVPEDKPEAVAALWMWCPTHRSKQLWDLCMLLLIVYSCVVIPYRIGMGVSVEGELAHRFETLVTVWFIMDLVLNFNTAFAEGPFYVVDRGRITRNYLRGWFWIDLASSFPFEEFEALIFSMYPHLGSDEDEHGTALKLLRALRMFRLLRLLRLFKLQQYIDSVEDRLGLSLQVLQIVKMVAGLLYLMHVLGCLWFFIGSNAGYETTWLTEYDGGSALSATTDVQYLYSIYWALMTLTTVGYGDITPANNVERTYALVALLVGALVFGYMLSAIGDLIKSLDPAGGRLQEKLDMVKEFTRWHAMPPDLAARVRKYYEFYYSRQSTIDERELMLNFAPSLGNDVLHHLLERSVGTMPFFHVPAIGSASDDDPPTLDMDFQAAVHKLLRPLVREVKEVVAVKSSLSSELIFLQRGSVSVLAGQGRHALFTITEHGALLLEHALTQTVATCDLVCAARCEFVAVGIDELLGLFERFPHAPRAVATYVQHELVERARKRAVSLLVAASEFSKGWTLTSALKAPGGRGVRPPSPLPPPTDEALQKWAATRLQVGWLWRKTVLLHEKAPTLLLPILFGAPRKQPERPEKLMRGKAAKIAVEAFGNVSVPVGVLPFGGALIPKIVSPRAQQYAQQPPPPPPQEPSTPSSGRSKGASFVGAPSAEADTGGVAPEASGLPLQMLEQLSTFPEGYSSLDARLAQTETQLAQLGDTLAKLAAAKT